MPPFPENLAKKLENRINTQSLRILPKTHQNLIDFSSNDYLGIAQNNQIFNQTHEFLTTNQWFKNGSTGSRLLSGNHPLYSQIEELLTTIYRTENALVFNSGYNANVGFFSSIPQKGDVVLYDELCHASIREGLQLSNAKSYKYKHLDYTDLEKKLLQFSATTTNIYVATESVFSMDGDMCDLEKLTEITEKYKAYVVVDEAHSAGYFGKNNTGLVANLALNNRVFAQIITFGKAYGCHGAAVLGSKQLINYLTNFARSFIYTTALSPHSLATLWVVLQHLHLENNREEQKKLVQNIAYFKECLIKYNFRATFTASNSPIQSCIIGGNERIKKIANYMKTNGFDVKPILSPTVPEGTERLRFCLHSYNTPQEINNVLGCLQEVIL